MLKKFSLGVHVHKRDSVCSVLEDSFVRYLNVRDRRYVRFKITKEIVAFIPSENLIFLYIM